MDHQRTEQRYYFYLDGYEFLCSFLCTGQRDVKKAIKCECKAMTRTKFVCYMICDPIQGFREQNFMGFQLSDLSFEFFKDISWILNNFYKFHNEIDTINLRMLDKALMIASFFIFKEVLSEKSSKKNRFPTIHITI